MSVSYKFYESNANWFQISQGSYDYFITISPGKQPSKKFRDNTYTMTYDKLGRILTRSGDENTTWTYSDTPGHLGELETITTNNGTAQSYNYDALGRVTLQTETVSGQDFTKSYSYDSYGRVQTETWNTGFGIQNTYNQHGYLSYIKTSSNQLIWQPNAYNARGQVTNYLRGTNLVTQKYYDGYGFQTGDLTSATGVGTFAYNAYDFDEIKGNLLSRNNHLTQRTENFTYDNLNRLTNENVVNGTQLTTSFAPNGNISQKTDIGTYAYGDAGPHAVTGLTSTTGTLMPANDQTVDYTAFSKASHIGQGGYDYYITYSTDRQRSMSRLINGITEDILQTKYYAFGDYEKEITPTGTRHLHYIAGGDGLAAIYVKYSNAPDSLYFIMTDHIGSIVGAINSSTGTVYRQNFDAWGRKRNPVNWSYTNIPDFPFDRGYTGHEHLKWFGLINMNGRMYDAALCRFLSPDPYVQMPDYTQNFNRYSYALNNPLIYSDPSGEFFWIPFAIGAIIGGYTGYRIADSKGYDMGDWQTYGYMLGGAAIGGLSGYAGASIAIAGGFMANTAGIMASSIVYSMGMTPLSGGTIPPNIGFGAASFNMGTGEFGYLGDPDNKWYENVGYGFGAWTNISDIWAFINGAYIDNPNLTEGDIREINLSTKYEIGLGHSASVNGKGETLLSFGAYDEQGLPWLKVNHPEKDLSTAFKELTGTTKYPIRGFNLQVRIRNVRFDKYNNYVQYLNEEGIYKMASIFPNKTTMHCAIAQSRALLKAGVFNIPFLRTPYFLDIQMRIRSISNYGYMLNYIH